MLILGSLQIPLVEGRGFARDLGFYLRCARHISNEETAIEAALVAVDYLATEAPWGLSPRDESVPLMAERVGAYLSQHGTPIEVYNAAADIYNAFSVRMKGPDEPAIADAVGNSAAPESGTSGASSPPTVGPATPSAGGA